MIKKRFLKTELSSKAPAIAVIMAGVLWGMINLFIRPLSEGGLDSFQIAFLRILVSTAIFSVYTLIKNKSCFHINIRDVWIFICTGVISLVVFSICYFYTIVNSEASVAVVLLYTSPIFIMALSAVFFKEKITLQKIIAVILTFGGCILAAGLAGGSFRISVTALITGILSGLFYALYSIFGRVGLKKYDTLTVTLWTFIFALAAVCFIGRIPESFGTLAANPKLILWVVGIGTINTALPYFLYTWGLQRMDTGKAGILVAVEPLVGAVIGMTVFRESHSILKIIGTSLILLAIILMNQNTGTKKKSSNSSA